MPVQGSGMDTHLPPVISSPAARRFSVFLKVSGICALILLLHIPLLLTNGVLRERQEYRRQAADEIAGRWGRAQQVTGPVLAVPYTYPSSVIRTKVVGGKALQVEETEQAVATAFFLPEVLAVKGAVDPEVRRRGIHETVVYGARLRLSGSFRPDFVAAGIAAERIDWDKAQVLFGVSDLRGIRSISPLRLAGAATAPGFEATERAMAEVLPLAAAAEGAAAGKLLEFDFEANLQGSERLQIAPAGKSTTVTLTSPWADPSFGGAFLPARREVGVKGFSADWEISHFSRGFPQAWTSRTTPGAEMMQKIGATAFGASFTQPVDNYRLADRAQKYGVLFFVLVFAVFFLFEMTAGARIHALQYAMVGAALCLFFLGFLALSEVAAVSVAYGISAAACTALVALYAWSFLGTGRRSLLVGGGLGATYGYLYFVLNSEDFALLAGTAALFVMLALVMFCTRRLNWYDLGSVGTANAGEPAR